MIKITSNRYLPIALLTLMGLTGCATTGTTNSQNANAAIKEDIAYKVMPGDRLSGISERFTGQVSNWEAIAAYNSIEDPRTLAAGATITIPGILIEPNQPTNIEQDPVQSVRHTSTVASNTRAPMAITTGNSVKVSRGRINPVEENTAISVFPVEVNRSFDLRPINTPLMQEVTDRRYDSAAPKIKVSGTYYPKGIYAEPANYSRLIRRAAPGTVFALESEVNAWYKISTEEGIGYIRQSDSTLVE